MQQYGDPEIAGYPEYREPQRRDNSGTMQGLVAMAIGVLTLLVAFTIIPIVGSELSQDVEGMVGATSQWNHSVNPDIPLASDLWKTIGDIIKAGGVVVVVAGFFKTLQGARS